MDISIFLKNGSINGIKPGITLEEYGKIFGIIEEQDKHYYDQDDLEFGFSYYSQGVEFMFVNQLLSTISIDPSSSEFTLFDKVFLYPYTSISQFIVLLEALDINWEFFQKHTYKQQIVIQLQSGVQLSFKHQKGYGLLFSKAQKYNT